MIAITGATGQLGRLVIEQLLKTVPANQIVAIASTAAIQFTAGGYRSL